MATETITAKNEFHNTKTTLRVKDGRVSAATARKLGKKMCASDCECGRTKFYSADGRQMLADTARDGALILQKV